MKKQVFEVWRAIKGYEGYYEVSNWGRVKSVERDVVVVRNGKQLGFNQGKISESCNNKYLKEGNNKYKNNIWSYMLM